MAGKRSPEGAKVSPILAKPWLLLFLPVNAALAGFTVILPLIILYTYNSNVVAVALAQTLYGIFLIPGSIIWGHVCDRMKSRVALLLFNYLVIAGVFLSIAEVRGLNELLFIYSVFGLLAPAGAAPSSLLIMEHFSPSDRPAAFASFSEVNMIGSCVGILIGFFWISYASADLPGFLVIAAILAVASAVLLVILAPERRERLEGKHLIHHAEGLVSRMHLHYLFFPRLPSRRSFSGAWKWFKQEAKHEVPLILGAAFLFNFSTNLFNTSYTPYMEVLGLGAGGIFLVNLSNYVGQVFSLPLSARTSEGAGAGRTVVGSTWTRVVGYGGVMLMSLFPVAIWEAHGAGMGANLAFYGLLGIAVAFYGTSSSLLLFRSLEGRNKGTYLGFNSALGGLAAVLGSAFSGVITITLGFSATFFIAMLAMASAVPIWMLATRAMERKHL
jgi:MFS family permease